MMQSTRVDLSAVAALAAVSLALTVAGCGDVQSRDSGPQDRLDEAPLPADCVDLVSTAGGGANVCGLINHECGAGVSLMTIEPGQASPVDCGGFSCEIDETGTLLRAVDTDWEVTTGEWVGRQLGACSSHLSTQCCWAELPETQFVPRLLSGGSLPGTPALGTTAQIINTAPTQGSVLIDYYSTAGNENQQWVNVPAHGAVPVDLIGADDAHWGVRLLGTEGIHASVEHYREDGTLEAATGAMAPGATELFLPFVSCDDQGNHTHLHVQNTGSTATDVEVQFNPSAMGQPWVETHTVGPFQSHHFDQAASCAALGTGPFVGGAVVRSLDGNDLVASVLHTGPGQAKTAAYDANPEPAAVQFAAQLDSNSGPDFTTFHIQNAGDQTTTVEIQYTPSVHLSGNQYLPDAAPRADEQAAYTLEPGETLHLAHTAEADVTRWSHVYLGTAIIRSSNGQPLASVVTTAPAAQGPLAHLGIHETLTPNQMGSRVVLPIDGGDDTLFTQVFLTSGPDQGAPVSFEFSPWNGVTPGPWELHLNVGHNTVNSLTNLPADYRGYVTVSTLDEATVGVLATRTPGNLDARATFRDGDLGEITEPDCASGDCENDPDCVFSADCQGGEVCWDNGACGEPTGSCDEGPNPELAVGSQVLPDVLLDRDTQTPWPSDVTGYVPDNDQGRILFFEEVTQGMDTVSVQGNDLQFGNAMVEGPIRQLVQQAWNDHEELSFLAFDPSGAATRAEYVERLAQLRVEKTHVRGVLPGLDASLTEMFEVPSVVDSDCSGVFDYLARPDGAAWYQSLSLNDAIQIDQATSICINGADNVISSIEALTSGTTDAALFPTARLFQGLAALESYATAIQAGGATANAAWDEHLSDCTTRTDAREVMHAVEFYGTFARDSAVALSNMFPITDMPVEFAGVTMAVGKHAASVSTDGEIAGLLNAAVVAQRSHMFEAVGMSQNIEQTVEHLDEVAPLLLILPDFLAERPYLQTVYDGLVEQTHRGLAIRAVAGTALGLGCAGGVSYISAHAGPVAPIVWAATIGICGADVIHAINIYNGAVDLHKRAMTLRFAGTETSLAAHDVLADAKFNLNVETAAIAIGAVGAVFEAGVLTRAALRKGFRATRLARGLRGFGRLSTSPGTVARAKKVVDSLEHRQVFQIYREFPYEFPFHLVDDEAAFVDYVMGGNYWPYHSGLHTQRFAQATEETMQALLDAGLIDEYDVVLGRIVAYFHDASQTVEEVDLGRWAGASQVKRVPGKGEIDSAAMAADWMRSKGFHETDIQRVERAIIDGTTVSFSPDHALVPKGLVEDAAGFFQRPGALGPCTAATALDDCDFLPLVASVSDFWVTGAGDLGDNLFWWRQFISEEYPAVLMRYAYAKKKWVRNANRSNVRDFLEGQAGFQVFLTQGRKWVALNSYDDLLDAATANTLRNAMSTVHGNFDDNAARLGELAGQMGELAAANDVDGMLGLIGLPVRRPID